MTHKKSAQRDKWTRGGSDDISPPPMPRRYPNGEQVDDGYQIDAMAILDMIFGQRNGYHVMICNECGAEYRKFRPCYCTGCGYAGGAIRDMTPAICYHAIIDDNGGTLPRRIERIAWRMAQLGGEDYARQYIDERGSTQAQREVLAAWFAMKEGRIEIK